MCPIHRLLAAFSSPFLYQRLCDFYDAMQLIYKSKKYVSADGR
jgi:hypothetical protein